jgi:SAM-dependent methyltransferase
MSEKRQIIDVERLVQDVRERVARESLQGDGMGQQHDLLAEPVPPFQPIAIHPSTIVSNRRFIGSFITFVRRALLRVLALPLQNLIDQMNTSLVGLQEAVGHERAVRQASIGHEIAREAAARELAERDIHLVKKRFDGVDTALNALELAQRLANADEADAREHLARDLKALSDRFSDFERLHIATRLAKLERRREESADAALPLPTNDGGTAPIAELDYVAFEERFRPEETVRERQSVYLDLLRDRRRVVDLGCGRGELIELLAEAGVSAYGVDLNPDFVALAVDRGLEVVEADAVAHVRSLRTGAVDAIFASHLIEHLPTDALVQLLACAADVLPREGLLILETPNPESLLAGSVNFHRDPTHNRPIHPDTLQFLCGLTGFGHVEVKRLSPVPDAERLPARAPEDGRLSTHVDTVVNQLNLLLYGYQDYAVIARL